MNRLGGAWYWRLDADRVAVVGTRATPGVVTIRQTVDYVTLTPARARELANDLLEAASTAEQMEGNL